MLDKAQDLRKNIKIIDIEGLMLWGHLLQKVDRVVDRERIYENVENLTAKITVAPRLAR